MSNNKRKLVSILAIIVLIFAATQVLATSTDDLISVLSGNTNTSNEYGEIENEAVNEEENALTEIEPVNENTENEIEDEPIIEPTNANKNNTVNELADAGLSYTSYLLLGICLISAVYAYIRIKKSNV